MVVVVATYICVLSCSVTLVVVPPNVAAARDWSVLRKEGATPVTLTVCTQEGWGVGVQGSRN